RVHAGVAGAVGALILGEIDAIVEERPQRAVGVAVVVFLDVLFFEIDGGERHPVGALRGELAGLGRRRVAAPAEPDAGIFAQRRRDRHGEAALARRAFGAAGGRDAVGDDNEAAHLTVLHGSESSTAQLMRLASE